MKKENEQTMWRFLLFAVIAWFLYRIIRYMIRSKNTPASAKKGKPRYDVGTQEPESPPMQFKDVRDAEFKDITDKETDKESDKEKVSK